MIDKIKKYLLRHNEINFYKKNNSGSEYYKVGNSIIRVSDHVAISNNRPDTLNIIVNEDNFVVMYGNKIINVNNYEEFKKFLKYHIQMCDCFKDIINKGLSRKATSIEQVTVTPKPQMKIVPEGVTQVIYFKDELIDVSDLSKKQYKGLISMQNSRCFPTRKALDKALNNMRASL